MASFSRSQASFRPEPIELTGGPPSNAGQAAGTVNLGNAFGSLRKNGPRFDELAATAIANRAQERATVTAVEGQVAAQGVEAYGATKSAKVVAEANGPTLQALSEAAGHDDPGCVEFFRKGAPLLGKLPVSSNGG